MYVCGASLTAYAKGDAYTDTMTLIILCRDAGASWCFFGMFFLWQNLCFLALAISLWCSYLMFTPCQRCWLASTDETHCWCVTWRILVVVLLRRKVSQCYCGHVPKEEARCIREGYGMQIAHLRLSALARVMQTVLKTAISWLKFGQLDKVWPVSWRVDSMWLPA